MKMILWLVVTTTLKGCSIRKAEDDCSRMFYVECFPAHSVFSSKLLFQEQLPRITPHKPQSRLHCGLFSDGHTDTTSVLHISW